MILSGFIGGSITVVGALDMNSNPSIGNANLELYADNLVASSDVIFSGGGSVTLENTNATLLISAYSDILQVNGNITTLNAITMTAAHGQILRTAGLITTPQSLVATAVNWHQH